MVQGSSINQFTPVSVSPSTGTTDHDKLANRDISNQHPIRAITGLREALSDNEMSITTHVSDKNNPHEVTKSQLGLGNVDNTSDSDKPISTATQSALDGLSDRITDITNGTTNISYDNTISGLSANTVKGAIDEIDGDLDDVKALIPSAASSSNQLVDKYYVDTVDNDLQNQIDAIEAKSDVTDIVGTYAELENYDTSKLTDGDVIKVLQDETQNDAITYYRWVVTGGTSAFELIGSEGPYYTVAETDTLLGGKQNNLTTAQLNAVNSGITDVKVSQYDDYSTNKANVGLDNLNASGQMIIDSQNRTISNCILENPQNLKLEMADNVLTLKAGSTVVWGGDEYVTFTTTEDHTQSYESASDGRYVAFCTRTSGSFGTLRKIENVGSGSELPADGSTYKVFYTTGDKLFHNWSADHWSSDWAVAYPLCVIDVVGGVANFAKDDYGNDMIFQSKGYIGHHAFVFPNPKVGLIAQGFNDDGTLKSASAARSSLYIYELSGADSSGYKRCIHTVANGAISRSLYNEVNDISELSSNSNEFSYVRNINRIAHIYNGDVVYSERLPEVFYQVEDGIVTHWTPRQPVRTTTTEMLAKKQDVLTFDNTPTSGSFNPVTSGGIYTALGTKQNTINSDNKLSADNVDDTSTTNKFVTASEKTAIANSANISLSNLSADGQMIIDSHNGTVSNCILEIPHNLKLMLSGNTLTAKSGSILTDSGTTYQTITLTSDKTIEISTTGGSRQWVIFATSSGVLSPTTIQSCVSGTTDSLAGTAYHIWFDTNNKEVKYYGSDGTTASHRTYPLCVIDVVDGVASFAKDANGNDMIFNGAGFIGHHAFVYPNITLLCPNGYNADGTLKSVRTTISALQIKELSFSRTNSTVCLTETAMSNIHREYYEVKDTSNIDTSKAWTIWYVKNQNILYQVDNNSAISALKETVLTTYTSSATAITDFTISQPVKTATTEMLANSEKTVIANSANKGLSNLSADGQMVIDSHNGTVSNCILEIPQNINASIVSNVLTIKAPYTLVSGGSVYTTNTIETDTTKDVSDLSDGRYVVFNAFSNGGIGQLRPIDKVGSGSELPVDNTDYTVFYNTTDFSFYLWNSGDSSWHSWGVAYPTLFIDVVSGEASIAKDNYGNEFVFQQFGIIGHHIFRFPQENVGLIGNGYTSNNKLASINMSITSLQLIEMDTSNKDIMLRDNGVIVRDKGYAEVDTYSDITPQAYHFYYVKDENLVYRADSSSNLSVFKSLSVLDFSYDGTDVTEFSVRRPVRVATNEMVATKQDKLIFDSTPIINSSNPVTSGGIYTALNSKQIDLTDVSGYDATAIQVLKNVNGVLTWITEE